MELKIILGAISTICIGLLTNYIYDKLKKPLSAKSDFELNFKSKSLEFKVKSKKR
ncbi:hypothetical protein [Paraclostridium sordellii]|uniref:hypothetical protein n=1 Tax=Paraclostridium sordellii TaxID=1505 RepID=UPI000A4F2BF3|nr:hypothetical protein [Paeniclostridium sordellii]